MPALEIRHIRVRDGRLDLEVAVELPHLRVDARTAENICRVLPNLPNHLCVNNGKGPRFGDDLPGTELAHLLEHVIIELQGQACRIAGKRRQPFTGHTSWLEELAVTRPEGLALMRVTVTFADDLVALQAVKEATALVNWAVRDGPAPDADHAVSRIRAIM